MAAKNDSGAATADRVVELRGTREPPRPRLPDIAPSKNRQCAHPPRLLSPFRHRRLTRSAPHPIFRDPIAEASVVDDIMVDTAGGGCRALVALLEQRSA
jgi:hypothetical protein